MLLSLVCDLALLVWHIHVHWDIFYLFYIVEFNLIKKPKTLPANIFSLFKGTKSHNMEVTWNPENQSFVFVFLQHALKYYSLVFDAVYTPKITRLLKEAEESGATIVTGLEMFMGQAYGQYENFTGLPGKLNVKILISWVSCKFFLP